jgi:hypothetical protein
MFNKDIKFKCSWNWEDKFINGIWRSWDSIRKCLEYKSLSSPEEVLQQPMVRNPQITTNSGLTIGTRTKLAWGLLGQVNDRSREFTSGLGKIFELST